MMTKMGFASRWIEWILLCIKTASYSVLVNNEQVGLIIPGRGLRQGDSWSPYLFIICAKGLSALIKRAERRGDLHGIKICRGAPIISHLLFADDSFMFFRANDREAAVMKSVLFDFEKASSQVINLQKSEVFFSRNVNEQQQDGISNFLGCSFFWVLVNIWGFLL